MSMMVRWNPLAGIQSALSRRILVARERVPYITLLAISCRDRLTSAFLFHSSTTPHVASISIQPVVQAPLAPVVPSYAILIAMAFTIVFVSALVYVLPLVSPRKSRALSVLIAIAAAIFGACVHEYATFFHGLIVLSKVTIISTLRHAESYTSLLNAILQSPYLRWLLPTVHFLDTVSRYHGMYLQAMMILTFIFHKRSPTPIEQRQAQKAALSVKEEQEDTAHRTPEPAPTVTPQGVAYMPTTPVDLDSAIGFGFPDNTSSHGAETVRLPHAGGNDENPAPVPVPEQTNLIVEFPPMMELVTPPPGPHHDDQVFGPPELETEIPAGAEAEPSTPKFSTLELPTTSANPPRVDTTDSHVPQQPLEWPPTDVSVPSVPPGLPVPCPQLAQNCTVGGLESTGPSFFHLNYAYNHSSEDKGEGPSRLPDDKPVYLSDYNKATNAYMNSPSVYDQVSTAGALLHSPDIPQYSPAPQAQDRVQRLKKFRRKGNAVVRPDLDNDQLRVDLPALNTVLQPPAQESLGVFKLPSSFTFQPFLRPVEPPQASPSSPVETNDCLDERVITEDFGYDRHESGESESRYTSFSFAGGNVSTYNDESRSTTSESESESTGAIVPLPSNPPVIFGQPNTHASEINFPQQEFTFQFTPSPGEKLPRKNISQQESTVQLTPSPVKEQPRRKIRVLCKGKLPFLETSFPPLGPWKGVFGAIPTDLAQGEEPKDTAITRLCMDSNNDVFKVDLVKFCGPDKLDISACVVKCFKASQLKNGKNELQIYKVLRDKKETTWVPEFYHYEQGPDYLKLAIQLLGDDMFVFGKKVKTLAKACGRLEPPGGWTTLPIHHKNLVDITRQAVEAIKFVNDCGFIHRDIKSENFAIEYESSDYVNTPHGDYLKFTAIKVYLFDFNYSTSTEKPESYGGTINYYSPEILMGLSSSFHQDAWALGCTLYEFYYSTCLLPPDTFKGKDRLNDQLNFIRLLLGQHSDDLKPGNDVPSCCRRKFKENTQSETPFNDFLLGLLTMTSTKRLSMDAALNHTYLQSEAIASS